MGSEFLKSFPKNVSLNGMFFNTEAHIPKNATCNISLFLQDGEETINIKTEGKVIRNGPLGMAIQFTKILGLDSFNCLKPRQFEYE